MANSYTSNLNLAKPANGDIGWDDELNGNADILDAEIAALSPWKTGVVSQPDDGEALFDRSDTNGTTTLNTGVLRLTLFRARRTETITSTRTFLGGTAAGATPTICRIGIYSVAGDGTMTLVASTANDTALYTSGTYTGKTKALQASWSKTRGQLYAAGVLVVTAAAAPVLAGQYLAVGAEADAMPRIYSQVTGQTDLPASIATWGSQGTSGAQIHFVR